MIRVICFDFGQTLIDTNHKPFPHVSQALEAISKLKSDDGKPLRSCLVSDFTLPAPPVTAAKITKLFNEYLAILDQSGLRSFFEPVKKRVTLSSHAGVTKPDRRIFEKALERLGVNARLEECLLITEDPGHIKAARTKLHMATLQFRSDFDDWAQAPALIANLAAPHHSAHVQPALKARFAAKGIDLQNADGSKISATVWHPISVPGDDDLQDIHVQIPVEGKVKRGAKGEVQSVTLAKPSQEQLAEATSFVRSLAKHDQIAGRAGKRALQPTHEIKTDAKGKRTLVRKGFSAI